MRSARDVSDAVKEAHVSIPASPSVNPLLADCRKMDVMSISSDEMEVSFEADYYEDSDGEPHLPFEDVLPRLGRQELTTDVSTQSLTGMATDLMRYGYILAMKDLWFCIREHLPELGHHLGWFDTDITLIYLRQLGTLEETLLNRYPLSTQIKWLPSCHQPLFTVQRNPAFQQSVSCSTTNPSYQDSSSQMDFPTTSSTSCQASFLPSVPTTALAHSRTIPLDSPSPSTIRPQDLEKCPLPLFDQSTMVLGPYIIRQLHFKLTELSLVQVQLHQVYIWLPTLLILQPTILRRLRTQPMDSHLAMEIATFLGLSYQNQEAVPAGFRRFCIGLQYGHYTLAALYVGRCPIHSCRKTLTNFDTGHYCKLPAAV